MKYNISNFKKNRQVDQYLKIATIETGDYFNLKM